MIVLQLQMDFEMGNKWHLACVTGGLPKNVTLGPIVLHVFWNKVFQCKMCVPVFEIVSQVSLTTVYGYHKLELKIIEWSCLCFIPFLMGTPTCLCTVALGSPVISLCITLTLDHNQLKSTQYPLHLLIEKRVYSQYSLVYIFTQFICRLMSICSRSWSRVITSTTACYIVLFSFCIA